jgi:hypothetical protein
MTHSPKQNRKKDEALAEARDHLKSNVMHERSGKPHEQHKSVDMANGSPMMNPMGAGVNMPPQGNGGGSI